jgi:hypothetical protein
MEDKVVHLRTRANRVLPSEAEARARTAAALRAVRELAGRTVEEWAADWGTAMGQTISPDLVRAWERPGGPKPTLHWALAAVWLAGPPGAAVFSSLFLAQ